jgi:NAD(P)-dependent dehydrogenase (short-subunit alcohol dehydrogenase family)
MDTHAASNGPDAAVSVAVVFGASGGIGRALVEQLLSDGRYSRVITVARSSQPALHNDAVPAHADLTDETSIRAVAHQAAQLGTVRLVIVATGLLHDTSTTPEKSWQSLDGEAMARSFAINSIGPALVAKHFLPLLPRSGRSVFAALSARVGSIGDNRLGGWYSYRASKAALNMLLRTLSIELARRAPEALCVGLHPGTVDTALSQPFASRNQTGRLFTPEESSTHLLQVIERLQPGDSGRVFAWDGSVIPE